MKTVLVLALILLMSGCIPNNMKEQMATGMHDAQKMLADSEFKKAISQIELHKLRTGHYPNSLSELQYLSLMDSSMSANVSYTRLDSVYELNLKMKYISLNGKTDKIIDLKYPSGFWIGLGCRKSNVK